jgi:hypothetical protein
LEDQEKDVQTKENEKEKTGRNQGMIKRGDKHEYKVRLFTNSKTMYIQHSDCR